MQSRHQPDSRERHRKIDARNLAPQLRGLVCGCRHVRSPRTGARGNLSGAAGDLDRAVGCGRRLGCNRAHRRDAAGEGARPALQRRQSHRRIRCHGSCGDRSCSAGRLHDRHADRGNRNAALAGPDAADAAKFHASGADERGPSRHPGFHVLALQDGEGTDGRYQAGVAGTVQGLGHWTRRHLASRPRRLDAGDWIVG